MTAMKADAGPEFVCPILEPLLVALLRPNCTRYDDALPFLCVGTLCMTLLRCVQQPRHTIYEEEGDIHCPSPLCL